MQEQHPMTQTMNITETRRDLNQLVNEVYRGTKRVLVEKSGIPVAAIISPADLERLNRFEEERRQDFAVIDEIRTAFADVPEEELEREVARAVEAGRQEQRAEALKQQV